MTSRLPLHGKVEFHWEGNLLVINCVGPFNLESLQHYFELVKEDVAIRGYQVWKRLEIVDEDTLAPPDGMHFATEYFQWAEDNGCKKAAFVTKSKVLTEYLTGFKKLNIQPFTDEQEARIWLASPDN